MNVVLFFNFLFFCIFLVPWLLRRLLFKLARAIGLSLTSCPLRLSFRTRNTRTPRRYYNAPGPCWCCCCCCCYSFWFRIYVYDIFILLSLFLACNIDQREKCVRDTLKSKNALLLFDFSRSILSRFSSRCVSTVYGKQGYGITRYVYNLAFTRCWIQYKLDIFADDHITVVQLYTAIPCEIARDNEPASKCHVNKSAGRPWMVCKQRS